MTLGTGTRKIIKDIRFWILLFFLLRLIGIENPPLEISHNWRQSLTNMIARNFVETDANILYPRIDMAGNASGIIGSEFPFFNYLIYLLSLAFGFDHWYGRLINLIVSSFGIYFFYRLVEKLCNARIAFNAAIVLLASIWFAFSRKVMPDTFSVSFVIIGLFYCYDYLISGSKWKLLLYFCFASLGMLCKIPALCLLSPLAILLFIDTIDQRRKIHVYLISLISIITVSLWYFYWVPHLLATYNYPLYFPKGIMEGIKEILPLLPQLFEKFYFSSLSSYLAFAFFIVGIVLLIRSKDKQLKFGIGLITLVFLIFVIKTGSIFPLHNYYIIPFTPVMALIAGYGIEKFSLKYQYLIIILISFEGIANQQHDFFIKDSEKYKLSLEVIADTYIGKNKLVVINGGQSPQQIYFLHRKGWTVESDFINKENLDSLKTLGASFFILNKKVFDTNIEYYSLLASTESFNIYKIE